MPIRSNPAATPGLSPGFHRTLQWVALSLVGLGCVALVWYHRIGVDTAYVPAIIDEYWVAVTARWINEGLLPYRDFFQFHFPGSYYLYALAERVVGDGMTALRAVQLAMALLLGASVALWFRMHGRSLAASLGTALLICGPCIHLWPILTPHPPGMLALAAGTVLLLRSVDRPQRALWLLSGLLLFLAAWTMQTFAVLALATFAGALLLGEGEISRRRWAPWVVAGAAVPLLLWIGSLLAGGQWHPFLRQAVSFVVNDGYKQAGGINDVNLFAQVAQRMEREVAWSKIVFGGAAAGSLFALFVGPVLGLIQWRSVRRSLLLPAAIAPLIFLAGRTDIHHAFYLSMPGLLILATPRWEGSFGRLLRRLGLVALVGVAFAFFLGSMPHLRLALQAEPSSRGDASAQAAVLALAELGVDPRDPVAVMPWAANLYHQGVVPGHRFAFVSPAATGYQGEREWHMLRDQMRSIGTRWLAFYPASSAAGFLIDGRPAGYLIGDGWNASRVGRSGPVELWRLDPVAGAALTDPAGGR